MQLVEGFSVTAHDFELHLHMRIEKQVVVLQRMDEFVSITPSAQAPGNILWFFVNAKRGRISLKPTIHLVL